MTANIQNQNNNLDAYTKLVLEAQTECQDKMLPFLREHRANQRETLKKLKRTEVETFFTNCPLWEREKQSSGHMKFKHKITHLTVCFQNHTGKNNSSDIAIAQAIEIRDVIQKHVDTLGAEVFKIKTNWNDPINLDEARRCLINLENRNG